MLLPRVESDSDVLQGRFLSYDPIGLFCTCHPISRRRYLSGYALTVKTKHYFHGGKPSHSVTTDAKAAAKRDQSSADGNSRKETRWNAYQAAPNHAIIGQHAGLRGEGGRHAAYYTFHIRVVLRNTGKQRTQRRRSISEVWLLGLGQSPDFASSGDAKVVGARYSKESSDRRELDLASDEV